MTVWVLPSRPVMDSDRRFYLTMALALLATTILGFVPTFHLRFALADGQSFEPLRLLIFIHGLLFASWIMVFIIQLTLIPVGRTDLHRRGSDMAIILITAMILIDLFIALRSVDRSLTAPTGVDPRSWLAVPLLDVPLFTVLILIAKANRHIQQAHRRLVLVAMIDMMRPSLGRLLPLFGAPVWAALLAPLLFLVPQIVRDLRLRDRIHPATLWSSVAITGVVLSLPIFWSSAWWLGFADWMTSLVA